MKPALWTGFYGSSTVEEALQRIHQAGWRYVEIATEHVCELRLDGSPERAVGVRKLLGELGMTAPQAHAHLSANFADEDAAKRADDLATALKELPICAALGVQTVVLHPGWSPTADEETNFERNVEACNRLLTRAEELGVRIALENMRPRPDPGPPGNSGGSRRFGTTVEDLLTLIEAVGSPLLGICFDTSHGHIAGLDFPQAVRAASQWLWALHISDNDSEQDLHLLPFSGAIDWPPFLRALREVGFEGIFDLEIGGFSHVSPPELKDTKCRHILELATLMTSGVLERE